MILNHQREENEFSLKLSVLLSQFMDESAAVAACNEENNIIVNGRRRSRSRSRSRSNSYQ